MSFLGRLFGSEKALNTAVEGVSSALDKVWYTEEEKAEAAAKKESAVRQMVIDWMAQSKGQNLARRLIAIVITGIWSLMKITSTTVSVIAVFLDSENKANLLEAARVINESSSDMTAAMMLILGFYFAAPHMGSIAEAALKRFGKVKNV